MIGHAGLLSYRTGYETHLQNSKCSQRFVQSQITFVHRFLHSLSAFERTRLKSHGGYDANSTLDNISTRNVAIILYNTVFSDMECPLSTLVLKSDDNCPFSKIHLPVRPARILQTYCHPPILFRIACAQQPAWSSNCDQHKYSNLL